MTLPEIIPVETLFDSPVRAGASISPDGTKIAYLAPWKNRLNVWVQTLDAKDDDSRCVTADDNRSVYIHQWTDDPRWLLYYQDGDGDENWHLYRVDLENPDSPAVDLTPFPGAKVVPLDEARKGKVVVGINKRTIELFDLYEIDITTGELVLLAENPGHVASWLRSQSGDLLATALTADGDIELSRWDTDTRTLHPVATFDGTDYPMSVYPMVITPDGTGLWLGSNRDSDRTRLVRLDLATGTETEVDSHPTFDLDTHYGGPGPLIHSRRTEELIGARYLGERQVIHALDPHFAAVLENVQKLS
ncbi:MAG TPA: S9 family peptidase, partial [Mycobacterium sp.]